MLNGKTAYIGTKKTKEDNVKKQDQCKQMQKIIKLSYSPMYSCINSVIIYNLQVSKITLSPIKGVKLGK